MQNESHTVDVDRRLAASHIDGDHYRIPPSLCCPQAAGSGVVVEGDMSCFDWVRECSTANRYRVQGRKPTKD
jgi:hypothetical protein